MGGGIYDRFIPWELAVSKAPPHAKPIFTCESHKDEVGRCDEEFLGDKLELLGTAFLATLR